MKDKKIVIVIAVVLAAAIGFVVLSKKPEVVVEPKEEPKVATEKPKEPKVAPHVILNDLRYAPELGSKGLKPRQILKISWGTEKNQVAGFLQDEKRVTDGMPWTFRVLPNDKIWILDSINKRLKLFNLDGVEEDSISLEEMGKNVYDFAISSKGIFAFLNRISGEVFLVSAKDKKIFKKLPGFSGARSIEFSKDDNLLLDLPIANGCVKIALDGQLKGIYPSLEGLSVIESKNGGLYGLKFKGKKAELYLRKEPEEKSNVTLKTIEFDEKVNYKVWYTGGSIFGTDAKGNVYFNLIVCDKDGIMYSDKLYRCSPEGEILSVREHIADPELTTGLPRNRIVTPDGKLMAASYDESTYSISLYEL